MKEINIFNLLHQRTKRNYEERSTPLKPHFSALAKEFGADYWDGRRETGYGGYVDDGRWASIADLFIKKYNLTSNSSVLDIGCGKGFLLKELKSKLPGLKIAGIDISSYAIEQAPELIRGHLKVSNCVTLPFKEQTFDLVISINVFHNLGVKDLFFAVKEMDRVSKRDSYICVESYRNEDEKWNLMRWQLTCESFHRPIDWEFLFESAGHRGDYEFIFFT